MEKSVNKFINELKDIGHRLRGRCLYLKLFNTEESIKEIEEKNLIISSIEEYLIMFESKKYSQVGFFNDFRILSSYLELSDLGEKEKLDIILFLINKNMHTGILEENVLTINQDALLKHKYQTLKEKDINDLVYNGKLSDLMTAPDKELSPLERLQRTELEVVMSSIKTEVNEDAKSQFDIYNILVVNRSSLTKESLEIVLNSMKSIEISDKLIEAFRIILSIEIEKRVKKESVVKTITPKVQKVVSSKKYLSEKEYSVIRKEIYTYYNLYKGVLTRDITFDEAIYCASLMIKLGLLKEEIEKFFEAFRMSSLNKNAVLETYYLDNQERLEFYYEEDELKDIKDAYQELISSDNEEDYDFWKQEITRMQEELEAKINKKYDYEFTLAKRSS